jgi:hypothetical protein
MGRYSYSSKSSYTPRSLRNKEKKTKKALYRNIVLGVLILYATFAWILPNLVGGLSFLHRSPKSSNSPVSENTTLAPPVLNIPYEATNTATIRISGYASPNSKVQIYLDDDPKTTAQTNSDGNFRSDDIALVLGTNNIYGKTVDDKNSSSLPSKTIQLTYSNDKPTLDISSPSDNTQVKGGDKKVNVSGTTEASDNVSVNGITVIVSSDGHFSYDAPLNDGDNTLTITSTNSVGNSTQVQRKVTYSSS